MPAKVTKPLAAAVLAVSAAVVFSGCSGNEEPGQSTSGATWVEHDDAPPPVTEREFTDAQQLYNVLGPLMNCAKPEVYVDAGESGDPMSSIWCPRSSPNVIDLGTNLDVTLAVFSNPKDTSLCDENVDRAHSLVRGENWCIIAQYIDWYERDIPLVEPNWVRAVHEAIGGEIVKITTEAVVE